MKLASELPADLVPSWIEAIATALGVVVAVGALWFAYRQIRLTGEQMRATATREAENSDAQTRPYIGIDLVPGLHGPPIFDLVVENYGRSLARRVEIRLASGPFSPQSDGDTIAPALGRYFSAGFDLAPGARRRVFWHSFENENAQPPGPLGAPISDELLVTYSWAPGGGKGAQRFSESMRYDLDEYSGLTPSPTTGATSNGTGEEAARRNAVHALRSIAQHIGELRR